MTLEGDDNHEETPSSALDPGVEGMESPMQTAESDIETKEPSSQPSSEDSLFDRIAWLLPDDSDKDGDGRTGLLSTRTEVHALVIGVTAGAHFGLSGDTQLLTDILGLGVVSDRARRAQRIPQKYRNQAKQEMPYFVVGVAIGTGMTRANALAELGVGV